MLKEGARLMKIVNRRRESGVALLLSILALLLLSAIAAGMMYMANTETLVSNNFRQEEKVYFAARSGVEEVRDRMFPGNPNTINGIGTIAGVCLVERLDPGLVQIRTGPENLPLCSIFCRTASR